MHKRELFLRVQFVEEITREEGSSSSDKRPTAVCQEMCAFECSFAKFIVLFQSTESDSDRERRKRKHKKSSSRRCE